jgi:diguanylate cyclase (GGDEF)-like protein
VTEAFAPPTLAVGLSDLGRLMPMHLAAGRGGRITSIGATLARILGPEAVPGASVLDLFQIRRPTGASSMGDLVRQPSRIGLVARGPGAEAFRAVAVPVAAGGVLLNLSLGADTVGAIRRHSLTEGDFAATDLAVELMYLVEAKATLTEQLNAANQRLSGAKSRAEAEALTDPLTGLGNRRFADHALAEWVAADRVFALLHIDLDRFKAVNDGLGHAAGDTVLRSVGQILAAETRASDIAARTGGDEFVMMIDRDVQPGALKALAARLIRRISRPVATEAGEARIGASIGIVSAGPDGRSTPAELMERADAALYAAKRAGRGRAILASVSGLAL